MSTVVGVVVAVLVVAGVVMIVREVFGCTPPDEQADMVDLFEADPIIAAAPHDGQLVDDHARTRDCDSMFATGGSPPGPGFAAVMRLYTTPAAYSQHQLRERFDEPAAAGGWRVEEDQVDHWDGPRVLYCKQADGRAAYANVASTTYLATADDPLEPAVRVRLAGGRDGSRCNVDTGGQ